MRKRVGIRTERIAHATEFLSETVGYQAAFVSNRLGAGWLCTFGAEIAAKIPYQRFSFAERFHSILR